MHLAKFRDGARGHENVYTDSVPAQETAKHRAKFGWPSVSNVAVVTKARIKRNPLKAAGGTQTGKAISAADGPKFKFTILWRPLEDILLLNRFFPIVDTSLSCEDIADKVVRWCADGDFCVMFASCIFSEPRAAHFRPAF